MSPLAISVCFEQLKRGHLLSIKECFEMEFKMGAGMYKSLEVFEGVRAMLIDRDNQPNWKFKTLNEISSKDIESIFNEKESIDLDIYN